MQATTQLNRAVNTTTMEIQLMKATADHKPVVKNLMQFYMYDFSEYVALDVGQDGLFEEYDHLDDYWHEPDHRFPYVIMSGEDYIGFALVRYIESAQRNYYSVAEFFVMKKYRRAGIGWTIAEKLFNTYKGQWEVYQKESNMPAQEFWHRIINAYTHGRFRERFEDGRRIQDFRT